MDGVSARFADGTQRRADLLIGADGAARRLGSETHVEVALRAYEHQRSRRAATFVRGSRRSAAARGALPAGLPDALIRATPPQVLSFLLGRIIRPAEPRRRRKTWA